MSTRTMNRRGFLIAGTAAAGSVLLTRPLAASAQARPLLKYRSRGPAVVELQQRLGGLTADGVFGKLTATRVIDHQNWKGLLPDAVVGPLTWAHVLNWGLPNTTTSFTGTGARCVVIDKQNNAVFAVHPDGAVAAWSWCVDNSNATRAGDFTVSWQNNLPPKLNPNFNVENEQPGQWRLDHFIRFDGGNGIHAIPVDKVTNVAMHELGSLGIGTTLSSLGCVRVRPDFAAWLYEWLPIGSRVRVVERLTPGV